MIGPFAVLVVTFLLTGWALRATIDLGTEPLMQYRLFFELIVAGFVISLLRSKVGLVTYGVFGPIIISYMLLESGVFWGTFLFVNLFLIALVTYVTIEPFNLGTAHRIGTMIVTVGIAITVIHLMADLRILPDTLDGLGVFFPAIITGWYADRFARDLNERGWRSPSIRFIWTIVSILTAYLVLRNEALVSWFIHTPEAWVAVLVANVWFGSRGSLRLKEYLRFRRLFDRPVVTEFLTALRTRLHNARTYVARLFGSDRNYLEENDVLAIRRRKVSISNDTHAGMLIRCCVVGPAVFDFGDVPVSDPSPHRRESDPAAVRFLRTPADTATAHVHGAHRTRSPRRDHRAAGNYRPTTRASSRA